MATKLVKSYKMPNGKDIDGVAEVVKNLFCSYSNSDVSSNIYKDGSWIIRCMPKPTFGKGYVVNFNKIVGTEFDIEVTIEQKDNCIRVHYVQNVNELKRAGKSLFEFAPFGIAKLYGIRKRHKIPGEIDAVISGYLNL